MAATAMMEELQQGEEEAPASRAADSGGAIGAMDVGIDVEQLPQALQQLVAQLREVPPTIREVDLNGPDQGGDYFRMHPPAAAADAGALWCRARLWVLGLIGSCSSLRGVKLGFCGICSESEVERLCQGLKSNEVLQRLALDGNVGFGSEFGCGQVSHILASSSTSLEELYMGGVGLEAAGLSQVSSTLLANTASRLQILSVEHNPECLADERAPQLLAQLVSDARTSKCLCRLYIRETGLAVPGAALLSAALGAHDHDEEENTALERVQVGGPEPILNVIVSSLGRCRELHLLFSKEEEEAGQLAEPLAQMLRTNTSLRILELEEAHFSTQAWRCIFQALGANSRLSNLSLRGSTTLDHSVIDDLYQLCSVSPMLYIAEIVGAPLKGSRVGRRSKGLFTCSCTSCSTIASAAGGTGQLKRLIDELSAPAGPSMTCITREDWTAELLMPRSHRSEELSVMRRRVLSLMGSCASLKSIELPDHDVIDEEDYEDVEALCSGLPSNPVLEELTFDRNRGFGSDFGCAQLARVVSGCRATLRFISLQDVGMKISGLGHLVKALSLLATRGSTSVPMGLNISDNDELGDAGAHLLAQLLTSGPTTSTSSLTILDICNMRLGVSGARSLSLALKHNTSLRTLNVGEAEFEGPTALVLEGLINNQTLTHLILWKGGVKPDEGLAEILAQLLQSGGNTSALRILTIADVHFQPDEWRKIFGALEKNQVLKVLSIQRCYDLEPLFKDLMQLLQVNTAIEEIDLEETDLKDKGKIPIVQEALQRNKKQREYVNVLKEKLPLAQPSTGRLFLCGAPYAGKSTLRETMVRCHQQPQGGCTGGLGAFMLGQSGFRSLRPRTEGIEIQVLRKDDGMQISVWDMAGQEEYHALHDYLFPNTNQACIFVFVYNPLGNKGLSSGNGDFVLPTQEFREMLLYWLRFIASNSRCQGHVLPTVCIVITNLDRLPPKYSQNHVVRWAEQEVDGLRRQFQGVVQVSECIQVVTAHSTSSVQPVVEYFFKEFEELLGNKLSPVFKACGDMSLALARLTTDPKATIAPMVRLADFYTMCSKEVEDLRHLFQDQPQLLAEVWNNM